MSSPLSNPELDQLVRELNSRSKAAANATGESEAASDGELEPGTEATAGAGRGTAARLDDPSRQRVAADGPLADLLFEMERRGASDLHLVAGRPPMTRVDGALATLGRRVLEASEIAALFDDHLGARERNSLVERGAADFSLVLAGQDGHDRYRVNLHRQRAGPAAVVRRLPRRVPSLAQLGLPEELAKLVAVDSGLVVLSGPTGSGKTTTLAALIAIVNASRAVKVVTIEEPIEYQHTSERALIEQIEIGYDSPSFAEALRSALRQDPDVILVGEMRDLETIATALTAAETGHLILTTLHTSDAVQAVHRLVDVFPASQQSQIRQQLGLSLTAIVTQRLLPRSDGGGRVPAVEILKANHPVRNHVRSGKSEKLYTEIVLGQRIGMRSMEMSLADLIRRGLVSEESAFACSTRPEELQSLLGKRP